MKGCDWPRRRRHICPSLHWGALPLTRRKPDTPIICLIMEMPIAAARIQTITIMNWLFFCAGTTYLLSDWIASKAAVLEHASGQRLRLRYPCFVLPPSGEVTACAQ